MRNPLQMQAWPQAPIRVVVSGTQIELTRDEVVARLTDVSPGAVRTHAVEVDGRTFPVKEAFAVVTGLDVLDFNTNQARAAFKHLGFKVMRVP